MSYSSVDALQKTLAESVFAYAADRKKAAGRALGTLVEIITYYALCTWGLRNSDLPPETRSRKNVRNWAKGGERWQGGSIRRSR